MAAQMARGTTQFSEINLYSTTCKLQLPLKSVVEEYKVIKAGAYMTVRESRDDKIKYSGVKLRTGRKVLSGMLSVQYWTQNQD